MQVWYYQLVYGRSKPVNTTKFKLHVYTDAMTHEMHEILQRLNDVESTKIIKTVASILISMYIVQWHVSLYIEQITRLQK